MGNQIHRAEYSANSPEDFVVAAESGREPRHQSSLTDMVTDLALTGTPSPLPSNIRDEIPGEAVLRAGDPDVDLLKNEYSGEEVPGAEDMGRHYPINYYSFSKKQSALEPGWLPCQASHLRFDRLSILGQRAISA